LEECLSGKRLDILQGELDRVSNWGGKTDIAMGRSYGRAGAIKEVNVCMAHELIKWVLIDLTSILGKAERKGKDCPLLSYGGGTNFFGSDKSLHPYELLKLQRLLCGSFGSLSRTSGKKATKSKTIYRRWEKGGVTQCRFRSQSTMSGL